jgi:transcriptional regulator with XRE-family HTH domain
MTLGEKIKFARMHKKISQQDLSVTAETHQKNISKYEQDLVVPSATTLKRIADALDVTTDYLLGGENENSIKDTVLLKQFKEVDKLKENEKSALMMVIENYLLAAKTRKNFAAQ